MKQEDFKPKLNELFKQLRKAGYFARQNIACCSSCGWAAVPDEKSKRAVFYHEQDVEDIKEGHVHLAWDGDGTEICELAHDLGFVTDWNGSRDRRIHLIAWEPYEGGDE